MKTTKTKKKLNVMKVMMLTLLMAMSFGIVHAEDADTTNVGQVIDETNLSDNMKQYIKDKYIDDGKKYDEYGNEIEPPHLYSDFTSLTLKNPTKEDLEAVALFENVTNISLEDISDTITELNFPNEKLKSVSIYKWAASKGIITMKGSRLSVTSKKIQTLTVNCDTLESLSVSADKLKTLKLSKSDTLDELYYTSKAVDNLDLSVYKKLRYANLIVLNVKTIKFPKNLINLSLYCGKKLKKIDLSNAKKLKTVDARGSYSSIDVSKNKEITSLSLISGKLNKLDVSKLSKLSYLNVSLAVAKTIDVRKNKKLTSLDVYNAKISSLKIGKNKKLWNLNVSDDLKLKKLDVSNLKELQQIDVTGSGISKLNLNKNKKVECVKFTVRKIKSFKGLNSKMKSATLCMAVKKNKTVDIKKYIGSGWKVEYISDKLKCKSGKIKVSRPGYVALSKGKKHRYIYFNFN